MPRKILIVDDDPATVKFIVGNLEANGYDTLHAKNGEEALQIIEKEFPDLVLLDIMMPKIDGFETCRRLRQWSQLPVIMVSARNDEKEKVKCLDIGADDYICKPFHLDEMLARMRAVLRRTGTAIPTIPVQTVFTSGNLKVDFMERRVKIDEREIDLTVTEFALLQELALNSSKVLTYQLLLNRVWGPEYGNERDYLYVFIRRLRKKLEGDPQHPLHILSVQGVGYRIV